VARDGGWFDYREKLDAPVGPATPTDRVRYSFNPKQEV
jgi:hypothetical protein